MFVNNFMNYDTVSGDIRVSTIFVNTNPENSDTSSILVENKIASRVQNKDATVYDFSNEAAENAKDFMGWTTLASNATNIDEIQTFANACIDEGLEHVILMGLGGSSQAPMTISKIFNKYNSNIGFTTLDSVAPLYINRAFENCDIDNTLFIVSSKSGGTIETIVLLKITWDRVVTYYKGDTKKAARRFIAITDGDNKLCDFAKKHRFRRIFRGIPEVGGRFSALSVYGLVPAALIGVDVNKFVEYGAKMEAKCAQDSTDNPAIQLASFLYDNVSSDSSNAFSYMSPQPGRVFGLWLEQMIAESLGKEGKGILPQIEVDSTLLKPPYPARPVVAYKAGSQKVMENFECDVMCIAKHSPVAIYTLHDVYDISSHFVLWKYTTAFLGYLYKVAPFNQPDVQLAKVNTSRALHGQLPNKARTLRDNWAIYESSKILNINHDASMNVEKLLVQLFSTIEPDDYVSINAFLPFEGPAREPIERIRNTIGTCFYVPTCLEIGPRYLHSTGQLHKGGPNKGVFLIISATDDEALKVPGENYTINDLLIAQSKGDLASLSSKDRRALHIHLIRPDLESVSKLAKSVEDACKKLNAH